MKKMLFIVFAVMILFTGCTSSADDNLRYTGTVEATQYDISSEIGGFIKEIYVEEGDLVKEGQRVALLDDATLNLNVLQKEAAYMGQEAQLKDVKKGSREEEIDMAQQQLSAAQSAYELAVDTYELRLDNYQKTKALYEQGAVPEQQLKDTELLLKQGDNSVKSAQENLNTAKSKLTLLEKGTREDIIKANEYNVDQSKYAYEQTKIQQEKASLKAQADGIILYKNFQKGEVLPVGAPVVTLIDTKDLWVKIYIPEKELNLVTMGQEVTLFSDIVTENTIKGKIIFIAPQSEFTPSNVTTKEDRHNRVHEVKVKITEGVEFLNPGMILDVDISR
ncbi:MAG: HlyD family secretion protein [Bacillota bacterium]